MARRTKVPSYRFHKPSGQAIVSIAGRMIYLGLWDSEPSRAKYDRVVAEWLANRKDVAEPEPTGPSVMEVAVAFWEHAQGHYRHADGTLSEELGNLKVALRPLNQLYGDTPAKDFGPLGLRAVRERMIADGLTRKGINARVGRIKRAFKWAASIEMVPVSVVQALATVAGLQKGRSEAAETDPVGPVEIEVVEATIPHLSPPVAALVRFQLLTGARPGEACSVRWCDLAEDADGWIYTPATHKNAHREQDRPIVVGPKALAILQEFRKPDDKDYLFDPREAVAAQQRRRSEGRKSKRTPSEVGKLSPEPGANHSRRYSRASYRNAIVSACKRAFPHPTLDRIKPGKLTEDQAAKLKAWRSDHAWNPNQLRHRAGTDIRAKYGLEASQAVLGHARADVSQIYAARDLGKAREVAREIG